MPKDLEQQKALQEAEERTVEAVRSLHALYDKLFSFTCKALEEQSKSANALKQNAAQLEAMVEKMNSEVH